MERSLQLAAISLPEPLSHVVMVDVLGDNGPMSLPGSWQLQEAGLPGPHGSVPCIPTRHALAPLMSYMALFLGVGLFLPFLWF